MLEGKVAFITGSTRGIGWATARMLASRRAATIVLHGRSSQEALDAALADLRARYPRVECQGYLADLNDPVRIEGCFQNIFKAYRRLNILVNNAGVLNDAIIGMIRSEAIQSTFAVNAVAVAHCIQAGARLMLRSGGGSIVNVSSIIGTNGNEGQLVYAGTKAAVIGMTKAAARASPRRTSASTRWRPDSLIPTWSANSPPTSSRSGSDGIQDETHRQAGGRGECHTLPRLGPRVVRDRTGAGRGRGYAHLTTDRAGPDFWVAWRASETVRRSSTPAVVPPGPMRRSWPPPPHRPAHRSPAAGPRLLPMPEHPGHRRRLRRVPRGGLRGRSHRRGSFGGSPAMPDRRIRAGGRPRRTTAGARLPGDRRGGRPPGLASGGCQARRGSHPDLALLLPTSGTTGSPKLVRLTAENLLANALSIIEYLGLDEREVPVLNLPLHYSYGLSVLNSHLLCGAKVVFATEGLLVARVLGSAPRPGLHVLRGVLPATKSSTGSAWSRSSRLPCGR